MRYSLLDTTIKKEADKVSEEAVKRVLDEVMAIKELF